MVIEFNKNISKATIDVREFMKYTNNCILSDKDAAEWLRKFRSDLFSGLIDETKKAINASKSNS